MFYCFIREAYVVNNPKTTSSLKKTKNGMKVCSALTTPTAEEFEPTLKAQNSDIWPQFNMEYFAPFCADECSKNRRRLW